MSMPVSALDAVVLAGGIDTRLSPLTSADRPKCLLPVANSPILLSPLLVLKKAGATKIFVVASGETVASRVQKWIQKEPQLQGLEIQVVPVASESGSADAVRCVADKLTGNEVIVMSGDTMTDIPLANVIFSHRIRGSSITTVLTRNLKSVSSLTKAGKTPKGADYVAVDPRSERLLCYAYDPHQLRKVAIPRTAVAACSSMTLSTHLRDACIYLLSQPVIARIKDSSMSSIKVDLLPHLVNEQWRSSDGAVRLPAGALRPQMERPELDQHVDAMLHELAPRYRCAALRGSKPGTLFCGYYLTESDSFCRRVNTAQSLLDANRDLAAALDAAGRTEWRAAVELGNKAVVSGGCLIGERSVVGDKSSIKRSVVGAVCKIGSNVKILNSVLMEGCSVGDGAHIQNCILGANVQVGSKATVKDCHIGFSYIVADNADLIDEQLALS